MSAAASSSLASVKSVAELNTLVASLATTATSTPHALAVLLFYADWHAASVSLTKEVLPSLVTDFGKSVKFVVCDAEAADDELTNKYNVSEVPTTVFIKYDGTVLSKLEGADPGALQTKVKNYSQLITIQSNKPDDEATINARLRTLINAAPLMIFIKGTPSAPRCGFTRQLIELLTSIPVTFSFFDILSDTTVREKLKILSNWPTYPQVFVNGELVGGLDVVKELHANGEFVSMLPDVSTSSAAPTAASADAKQDPKTALEARLKKLISSHNVMLFMKGTKDAPACGFSRKAVGLLNEVGADFNTVNILEDNEVREGLKVLSNWPTYPQLYVKGELVGGIDVMTELHQAGELKDQVTNQ